MSFWKQGQWWAAETGSRAISRDEFALAWKTKVAPEFGEDGVDPKQFLDELKVFAGVLGRCDWVKASTDYGHQPAMFISQDTGQRVDEPDSWDKVSKLFGEYVDGFARYSASFVAVVQQWKPDTPDPHNRLRDVARKAPMYARRLLLDPSRGEGSVLASQRSADAFLADPDAWRRRDTGEVLRLYGFELLADKSNSKKKNPYGDLAKSAIDAAVRRISDEVGLVETPTTPLALTAENAEKIEKLFTDLIASDRELRMSEDLGEAWRKTQRALEKMVQLGKVPTHVLLIYRTAEDAGKDRRRAEYRRQVREPSLEGLAEQYGGDEPANLDALPFIGVAESGFGEVERDHDLIENDWYGKARDALDAEPAVQLPSGETVEQFWEKETALGILDDIRDVVDRVSGGKLEPATAKTLIKTFVARDTGWWPRDDDSTTTAEPPAITTVSNTKKQASAYIRDLLWMAIGNATPSARPSVVDEQAAAHGKVADAAAKYKNHTATTPLGDSSGNERNADK